MTEERQGEPDIKGMKEASYVAFMSEVAEAREKGMSVQQFRACKKANPTTPDDSYLEHFSELAEQGIY